MQTARPSLPANSPSLRPGSQTPTATVYTPNQPFMMTMTPMPFPTQTHQYYIPQVKSQGTCYILHSIHTQNYYQGSHCDKKDIVRFFLVHEMFLIHNFTHII